MEWREKIDKSIKDHLELQVKEAAKHKSAYLNAPYPRHAQLWVAIANLSKQIFDIELKLKFIEGALREISKKQIKTEKTAVTRKKKK